MGAGNANYSPTRGESLQSKQRAHCLSSFPGPQGQAVGSNRKPGPPVSEQGWHYASCSGARKLTPVTRAGTLGHSLPRPPRLLAQPAKQGQVRRKAEGYRSSIKIYFEHVCVEGASQYL